MIEERQNMSVIAIIPARYGSTRFPGKPLADLCGKPLVVHVADRASEADTVDEVVVATDDERIRKAVQDHGYKAVMTSPDCATGTDRIAEVVAAYPEADIVVNVQGDEPLMPPSVIDRAVAALQGDPECAVSTAMIRLSSEEDFLSPHVVKVVCDLQGRALYFSRSPIPNLTRASDVERALLLPDGQQSDPDAPPFWGFKHFGLYIYRREALLDIVKMPQTPLEQIEKLEQLRFLENGMRLQVVETELNSIGVDTPEDLEAAIILMKEKLGNKEQG